MTRDEKDWTWVITTPCGECGFDGQTLTHASIVQRLRDAIAPWPRVLDGATATIRPSPDVWSPLEYACHIRDVCRIYDERLERMLTEDDPLYQNWDQDQTAIDDAYASQSPDVVSDELTAAAGALIARFETVKGEQWERRGRRSDGASFTVDTFSQYLVHDLVHHVWDVTKT